MLDHHPDNERFGTHNLVLEDLAATAVIVRLLADELGWTLTRDAALCLYVGLVTDTGRFQYPNTTPDVFHLAEELANYDLPIADVTRELFENHRFPYVQLMSVALARAELDVDRRFVSAWLTADDLDRYGVAFDETEGFIDHLRGCAEAEVSCVLREAPGEGLRVSLRSTGDVDVGEIATELGGGGHKFMSGFVSTVDPRDDRAGAGTAARRLRSGAVSKPSLPVQRTGPGRQGGRLDQPRRGGQGPGSARHPQGGPRRHARPAGDRAAPRRGGHDDPAAAVPHRAAQDLRGRDRARDRDHTLDDTGEVTATHDMAGVTLADVRSAAEELTGDIIQVPPMVSAVKIDGKRLHELAREGKEVERQPRPVTIHAFGVGEPAADGVYPVEVTCSSGTYIRTLAADVGAALGGGAHLRNLRRTQAGSHDGRRRPPHRRGRSRPRRAGPGERSA